MPTAAKIKKLELALRSGNTQERLAAIEDPDITADIVVLALNDKYWKVAKLAAAHPKLSKKHIIATLKGEIGTTINFNKLLDKSPNFDADYEMAAIECDKWWFREAVATSTENPNVLLKAIKDSNIDVRVAAAFNPNIGKKAIKFAVADRSAKVRAAIAALPKLSEEQITKLAEDKYPPVRAKAAMNPNIPVLIAARLAKDSDHAVSNLGKIALRKQLGKSINVKEE